MEVVVVDGLVVVLVVVDGLVVILVRDGLLGKRLVRFTSGLFFIIKCVFRLGIFLL